MSIMAYHIAICSTFFFLSVTLPFKEHLQMTKICSTYQYLLVPIMYNSTKHLQKAYLENVYLGNWPSGQ